MKTCILIAGMPASGKTTFALHLAQELGLPMISKDRIKEHLYNNLGFENRWQKNMLGSASMDVLYYFAEALMQVGHPFILENNFEHRSKPQLQTLLQRYLYGAITVRFGGDARVLYKRYLQRDKSPGRHRGHVVNGRYPDDDTSPLLAAPLSFEDFTSGIKNRGIGNFTMGEKDIYIDTTNFGTVQYAEIVDKVRCLMAETPVW